MPLVQVLILAVALVAGARASAKEPDALLEVSVGPERWQGRIAAHDDTHCWMFQRDGRLTRFLTDDVTDFREIESRFRPFSTLELRDRLQSEFGREFEVRTTQRYLVVARRTRAEPYVRLFDQIYREFHLYFTARGFRVAEPEFPLIAIVLPDADSFQAHCLAEGTRPRPGLVGFYLPKSNRVALYDRTGTGGSPDAVDATIIHEATHQVAFNTGIHSRIGPAPQWLVEGLATLFEAEGIRRPGARDAVASRLNPERWAYFRDQLRGSPAQNLADFVQSDALFQSATLDAYSTAWALSFYLAESRPAELSRYVRRVSSRNPLTAYPAEERLGDFRAEFGADLERLETGMRGFYERLSGGETR